jgi:leucyl/phenylalanyl-tRNA--protein transferase
MHFLTQKIEFPKVSKASVDGLLAVGGDLSPKRLVYAYKNGIFPWFDIREPILWWSPDPRFVLFPKDLKISKSMKQVLKKNPFKVTENKAFEDVIAHCSKIKRNQQDGTWITNDMIEAYIKLYHMGFAKSIEVWENNELVGGLYGIAIENKVFCGESMFAKVSNASKVGFITFVQNSNYQLIDCQLHTQHLESLGAKHISRADLLKFL